MRGSFIAEAISRPVAETASQVRLAVTFDKRLNNSMKKISAPEIFLLITLSIFGLLAIWWLPVGAGYDEETHLVRVWEMSSFDMLPNNVGEAQEPFPTIYWDLSYRRQFFVRPVDANFWDEYGSLPLDTWDYEYGLTTRSVYSPPLLLPQALVVRYAGRSLGWAALPVFYLTRLAGWLAYLVLVWVAVRLIPYGKWILALLAVSPVAILQAATISADSISNGIAFLFIGGILAIAQNKEIGWKKWWGILLLVFILFMAKVNLLFLILLLALISPKRYQKKIMLPLLVVLLVVLFLSEVVGWSVLAYPRLGTPPEGTDPIGQVQFILTHLPTALGVVFGHALRTLGERLRDWMAIYGYNYWPVPKVTYWLYAASLVFALFVKRDDETIPAKRERWMLGVLFSLGYIATIALMYVTFTPVGAEDVIGVQGRYFFVVLPLLFLALFGVIHHAEQGVYKRRGLVLTTSLTLGVLSLVAYSVGGWLSYHVPCGSQYYQSGYCYQPRYKNFLPEGNSSPVLTEDLILAQEFIPECDGMTTLRFWVNENNVAQGGSVRVSLTDLGGESVYEENLFTSNIVEKGWQSISFDPFWDSAERAYLLTLTSSAPNSDLKIAYSLRPEYRDGKLYENGEPVEEDLIFQYGCVAGWEKLRHNR